jgi:hypothetical protein
MPIGWVISAPQPSGPGRPSGRVPKHTALVRTSHSGGTSPAGHRANAHQAALMAAIAARAPRAQASRALSLTSASRPVIPTGRRCT